MRISTLLLGAVALLGATPARADQIELEVPVPAPHLWRDARGFTHVHLPGYRPVEPPGAPALPARTLMVLLPPGHRAVSVEVRPNETRPLAGVHQVTPVQRQFPQSYAGPRPVTGPRAALYTSRTLHRAEAQPRTWFKHGLPIAPVTVAPVAYAPATGRLSYAASLAVTVTTARDGGLADRVGYRGLARDLDAVRLLLANPDALAAYAPAPPPDDEARYVVVTAASLAACDGEYDLDALLAEKAARGVSTHVETADAIRAVYAGEDDPARVREFLRDVYTNHGAEYVLLLGDADLAEIGGETEAPLVPVRGLWGDVDFGGEELNMPADLYYACLDGDFDADRDGVYGEPTDEPDVLAELWVGRAPADSCAELADFVRKTLEYRATADPYLADVWLAGEWINEDYIGKMGLEEVRNGSYEGGLQLQGFVNNPFFTIHTLYDADLGGQDGWGAAEILEVMNGGVHILNHSGHSSTTYNMRLDCAQLDAGLRNTAAFFQLTTGCYPGSFDNREDPLYGDNEVNPSDSFTEHLVLGPHGAVGAVSYSRYGVGDLLPRTFWDAAFGHGLSALGHLLTYGKETAAGWLPDPYIRWQIYGANLFGDPELALHMSASAAPVLGLPADPLIFSAIAGDTASPPQTLAVRNDGGGTLEWTATAGAEWLTVTPASGTAPSEIAVVADPTGKAEGLHQTTLTFDAPGATGAPATVTVALYVNQVPGVEAPHTRTPPAVDGVINAAEYTSAGYVDMGMTAPGVSWAHFAHDNQTLYIALEIAGDPGDDPDDAVYIYVDSDNDDVWPPAPGDDGAYYIMNDGTVVFAPLYSTPDGYRAGDFEFDAPGITAAFSRIMDRRIAEVAIDLSRSHVKVAPGGTFGIFLSMIDKLNSSAAFLGVWPHALPEIDDCRYLGHVTLGLERDAVQVEPASLNFGGTAGAEPTAPLTLAVGATLDEPLDFELTSSDEWLIVTPAAGRTPATVEVRADPGGLAAGTYLGALTVLAPDAVNSPLSVSVVFTVVDPAPAFGLSPAALEFAMDAGGEAPEAEALSLINLGGGELAWTAVPAGDWLVLDGLAGTAPATVWVGVQGDGLPAGQHTGLILFTAPAADPAQVPVSLTVAAASSGGGGGGGCGVAGAGGSWLAALLLAAAVRPGPRRRR